MNPEAPEWQSAHPQGGDTSRAETRIPLNDEGLETLQWSDGKKYVGQLKCNRFHGRGTLTFADGRVYEGEFKDGRIHGQGRMGTGKFAKVSSGQSEVCYEGWWRNGQKHGKGRETLADGTIYTGTYSNGTFSCGVLVFVTGRRYDGEFQEGQRNGKGSEQWPDGATYVGEYEKGSPHGSGRKMESDGKVYEGGWAGGKRTGQGVMTWPDGRVYTGAWKSDLQSGKGTLTSDSGVTYEGDWKQGRYHGYGVQVLASGTRYKGEWRNGKMEGKGVQTQSDGIVYDGMWKDGLYHGHGVLTWPDTRRYEGVFQHHKLQGEGVCTWPNGRRFSGRFKNDRMCEGELWEVDGTISTVVCDQSSSFWLGEEPRFKSQKVVSNIEDRRMQAELREEVRAKVLHSVVTGSLTVTDPDLEWQDVWRGTQGLLLPVKDGSHTAAHTHSHGRSHLSLFKKDLYFCRRSKTQPRCVVRMVGAAAVLSGEVQREATVLTAVQRAGGHPSIVAIQGVCRAEGGHEGGMCVAYAASGVSTTLCALICEVMKRQCASSLQGGAGEGKDGAKESCNTLWPKQGNAHEDAQEQSEAASGSTHARSQARADVLGGASHRADASKNQQQVSNDASVVGDGQAPQDTPGKIKMTHADSSPNTDADTRHAAPEDRWRKHEDALVESFTWKRRVRMLASMAAALAFLHDKVGLLHGRFTRDCVLVTTALEPMVMCLDVCFEVGAEAPPITPSYCRCPRAAKTGTHSERSGVYALGVVMLEVLTGCLSSAERDLAIVYVEDEESDLAGAADCCAGCWDDHVWKAVCDIARECVGAFRRRPTLSEACGRLAGLVESVSVQEREEDAERLGELDALLECGEHAHGDAVTREQPLGSHHMRAAAGQRTCVVCLDDDLPVSTSVLCSGSTRHLLCSDCFSVHVTNESRADQAGVLRQRGGRIFCPFVTTGECRSPPYSDQEIAMRVPAAVHSAYMEGQRRLIEQRVVDELRPELVKELRADIGRSKIESLRKKVADNILTLKCPNSECQQAFIDFDGCFALACSKCAHLFCGYCFHMFKPDQSNAAHAHVTKCSWNETPNKDLFASPDVFLKSQNKRKVRKLREFLRRLDGGHVRDALIEALEKDLNDIGIKVDALRGLENASTTSPAMLSSFVVS